jgi:N-acetylmuramoyl-L-alanine amidase
MKIGLVIGHTGLSGGAYSNTLKSNEFNYNLKVANIIKKVLPEIEVFTHQSYNLGYKAMCKATSKKLDKFDVVFELHFNASNGKANGTEALYYFENRKGRELATRFVSLYCSTFRSKSRGAKALVNDKQRGFWAVFYPKPTTLILEPFFGDNPKDVINEDAYASFLIEYFKTL